MPTIKDVAARAGVAPSSVTRVLSGHPNVSPKMRERVMAAVDEVGYTPDLLASALRQGRTRVVGVLVSDVRNPTLASMVDALEVEFHKAGYGVLISSSRGNEQRDLEGLEALKARRVDGLVVAAADDARPAFIERLQTLPFPVVLMDRQCGDLPISRVLCDHYGGTTALVEHIIAQGHRSIGVLSGPADSFPTRERMRAAKDAAARAGIEVEPVHVIGKSATIESGAEVLGQLMDSGSAPDALIVGNALLLIGVLQEADRRGIRIGEDIAIASGDDTYLSTLHSPQITGMQRDFAAVGRESAQQLLAHLENPDRMPHTMVLPTVLAVRESTRRSTP